MSDTTSAARRYLEAALPFGQWAAVSRLLGRNHSYIEQYIKRGKPKWLGEADRNKLVEIYGLDPAQLLPPPRSTDLGPAIDRYRASLNVGHKPWVNAKVQREFMGDTRKAELLCAWELLSPDKRAALWGVAMALAQESRLSAVGEDSDPMAA